MNKIRTFLSLLGVTIGIFCIVSVFTLTKSLEKNVKQEMSSIGGDVIFIERWPWGGAQGNWWKYIQRPSDKYSEFKELKARLHNASAIAYVFNAQDKVIEYGDGYMKGVKMMGMTSDFDKIQKLHIASGRFFSTAETTGSGMQIILGSNIWDGLFSSPKAALHKKVTFAGQQFTVIGALKEYGNNLIGGFDYDNTVLLPYRSALKIVSDKSRGIDPFIMVKPSPNTSMPELREEARGAMRAIRHLQPSQEDNFALNEMSMMTGSTEKIFGSLNFGGLMIGIFALIVGAFGIANIMFVTVKERTNIIGLKKAIGAKRYVILQEFLIEAVLLCLVGGVLGLILVLIVTQAISSFVFFKVYMTGGIIIFGLVVSVITGIIAGIIPALSASKLNPVVAIRS